MKTNSVRSAMLRRFVQGFVILGVTAYMARPVLALTAAEVISRARSYLRDTSSDSTRQQFSDSTLLGWVNDAQQEANSFAWVLRSSTTFTLAAGTTEYALPSDFLATWRVEYRSRKLDQTSINELDATSLGWKSASGVPQKYYLYVASATWIGFTPAPISTSTGTVSVFYIAQPATLTSTSATPFNGWPQLVPYHPAIAYYVAYRGLSSIGDSALAGTYYQEWSNWIEIMRTGLLKMPDFNPGFKGSSK